jgi:predicted acylesterase/phospholipase RssA
MSRPSAHNLAQAKELLEGRAPTAADALALADRLKSERAFGYARKVLRRARQAPIDDPALRKKLRQQHAFCTYKDPDLPVGARLDRALTILGGDPEENLRTTDDQETLGLAGAIYKRLWEVNAQKRHLERALSFYLRAHRRGVAGDFGYTGINAAFVLDLLASLESQEAAEAGATSETAAERREQARRIREEVASTLPMLAELPEHRGLDRQWWFLVTMAEAHFGLQQYDRAGEWLSRARTLPNIPPWELETTARQLATLARLEGVAGTSSQDFQASPAGRVLAEFLGIHTAGALSAFVGKVGLALSGGGFRASLFHIGILARLAELDVLRHVEVLSCVSGGSILGAHYYLEVKRLLEAKPDADITREDYIEIVKRLERDFLAGVQRNIRMRVIGDVVANLRMIFVPDYSRTLRVGELFEKHIYSRVRDGHAGWKRWLTDLYVYPAGEDPKTFRPKYDNWRRHAKVPILILNATALNTGHNWQFTASWMGEPPTTIDPEIDGNYRLRRMYYSQAPARYKRIRLGTAVAASACVPGLFTPITLANLYSGVTLRLVDGGVHDNQGIVGLLEQDSTVLLVSDASGQMEAQDHPSVGLLGVPFRSNGILMARVREAEYDDLVARRQSGVLRGLMFIHLKKDLGVRPIDWIGSDDPSEDVEEDSRAGRPSTDITEYGIAKDIQRRLANIRTDLDSFSETEALALMTSGYRMTEQEFARSIDGFSEPDAPRPPWRFLEAERLMGVGGSRQLASLLDVAAQRALKVWRLSTPLKVVGALAGLGLVALFTWSLWPAQWPWWAFAPTVVAGALLVGTVGALVMRFGEQLIKIGVGVALGLVGWLAAGIHLQVFDRLYLQLGKLKRLLQKKSP